MQLIWYCTFFCPRRPSRCIDENVDNANIPLFNQHYRQEMFEVVDHLVSDMDDINNYFSNIVLPVTALLPQKIAKCTEEDAENLCATFPDDLKDPDTLRAELEMMGNNIEKNGAKNLRSFSKLRLVKSYLRSTMKEDCLDNIMILASANNILDCLDLDSMANVWSISKTRKTKI